MARLDVNLWHPFVAPTYLLSKGTGGSLGPRQSEYKLNGTVVSIHSGGLPERVAMLLVCSGTEAEGGFMGMRGGGPWA